MKRLSKRGRRLLIFLAAFVCIIVIGAAVLLNMTPAKLGMSGMTVFGSLTVSDLGIENMKIIDIIMLYSELKAPDESKILKNAYDEKIENEITYKLFENAYFATKPGGTDSADKFADADSLNGGYSRLLNERLYFPERFVNVYSDTTLAYIFNELMKDSEAYMSEDKELVGIADFFKSMDASVKELSVIRRGSDESNLRVVFGFSTKNLNGNEDLRKLLPETVYIVSNMSVSADENGVLLTEPRSLTVNGCEDVQAVNAILAAAGFSRVNDAKAYSADSMNALLGNYVSKVVSNIGMIGTAEVCEGKAVPGTEKYGKYGISDGAISFISYTED